MKAIAIVELPDDAFDKGKWFFDKIVYTENEAIFDDYAMEMWEIKPLPRMKNTSKLQGFGNSQIIWTDRIIHQNEGWNDCLDEIMGEAE